MSEVIEQIQNSTLKYLSELMGTESESYCSDLSALVGALLEDGGVDQIQDDMEPFLKEKTAQFMKWLKNELVEKGFYNNKESEKNTPTPTRTQEKKVAITTDTELEEPKREIRRLVSDEDVFNRGDLRANRSKRFGTILDDEVPEKKTTKRQEKKERNTERNTERKERNNANNERNNNERKRISEKQRETLKRTVEKMVVDAPVTKKRTIEDLDWKKKIAVTNIDDDFENNDNDVVNNRGKQNHNNTESQQNAKKAKKDFSKVKVTKGDGDSLQISVVQSKIPTRCYYYPKCTKSDCPYTHPDTTCALFPNCQFGSSCRYIHPMCKYDGACTKPNCPYTHSPFASVDCKNGFACGEKGTCQYKHPLIACKFAATCTNVKRGTCLFSHFKPCQSRAACVTPGCRFAHPGNDKEQTNSQKTNQDVEKLSESLIATPPIEENIDNNENV